MTEKRLYRYGAPCKYDQHPYGTEIVSMSSLSDKATFYKQISHNQENPIWEITDEPLVSSVSNTGTVFPADYDPKTPPDCSLLGKKGNGNNEFLDSLTSDEFS